MNKNERPAFLKGKGAAVGIVICFAAVIALVGAYTFSNYRRDMEEQMAKAEEQAEQLTEEMENNMQEDPAEEANTDDIVLPESQDGVTDEEETQTEESEEESTGSGTADYTSVSSEDASPSVWFSESSTLSWPASGAVIMSYSMDQTVFFQTLEQYRYNPAMIVSGEVGETISASAAGIVTDIQKTAQTGNTVTLDMGNGYSAIYGQLDQVTLSMGDYVAAGETVGTLAEPTKYYSVEGPSLYFEILRDGEPVDPLNYME